MEKNKLSEDSVKSLNIMKTIFGFDNPCYLRQRKIRFRNPDVFSYDNSIEYKEDYGLIEESVCNCGCKSAMYVKETWTGDGVDTELKTQLEYEKLPNQPTSTPKETQLQTDIIRAERKEEELGIIHNQKSCNFIPAPKLVFDESRLN